MTGTWGYRAARIAYLLVTGSLAVLVTAALIRRAGEHLTSVPDGPLDEGLLAWLAGIPPTPISVSPDGRRAVVRVQHQDATELVVRELASQAVVGNRRFAPAAVALSWRPDGRALGLFVRGETGDAWSPLVWEIDRDQLRRLQVPGTRAGGPYLRWSSDGRRLAYVEHSAGRDRLWMAELDGGGGRALFESTGITDFGWAPNGRKVAVAEGAVDHLTVVDTADAAPRRYRLNKARAPMHLDWSASGTKLVFTFGEQPETLRLARLDLSSGGEEVLPVPPGRLSRPRFLHGAAGVLFQRDEADRTLLWRLDEQGRLHRTGPPQGHSRLHFVSADDREVFIEHSSTLSPRSLLAVALDGGQERELQPPALPPGTPPRPARAIRIGEGGESRPARFWAGGSPASDGHEYAAGESAEPAGLLVIVDSEVGGRDEYGYLEQYLLARGHHVLRFYLAATDSAARGDLLRTARAAVTRELGGAAPGPVVVCGWGRGAQLASELVAHSSEVAALVLVDPVGLRPPTRRLQPPLQLVLVTSATDSDGTARMKADVRESLGLAPVTYAPGGAGAGRPGQSQHAVNLGSAWLGLLEPRRDDVRR